MKNNDKKPIYLMAGGPADTEGSIVKCLRHAVQACGTAQPTVAYIGVASGDYVSFFKEISRMLTLAGAGRVDFPRLAKTKADVDAAKKTITEADLIFVSGGDVELGMKWLERHNLIDFLRNLYDSGKLFCGLSAGCIMLGAKWVRWQNPDDDSTAQLFDCLNFTPAIFDAHAEEDNWIELRTALSLSPNGAQGFGIPSGAMITATANGKIANVEERCISYTNNGGKVEKM